MGGKLTRRSVFAAVSVLALTAGAAVAQPSDQLAAWRRAYSRWAENGAIWPLMREASALGFRPDQVICILPNEKAGGPCVSLAAASGDYVHIYAHGTLRVHARNRDGGVR